MKRIFLVGVVAVLLGAIGAFAVNAIGAAAVGGGATQITAAAIGAAVESSRLARCGTGTVTIAEDAYASAEIDTAGCAFISIGTPATWDGTVYTWQCSPTDDGTAVTITDDTDTDCTTTTAASSFAGPASGACALAVAACNFVTILATTQQTTSSTVLTYHLKE